MVQRWVTVALGVLAASAMAAGCGSSSGDTAAGAAGSGGSEDPIKLGTSMPTSGPVGKACTPYNDGSLAWFEQVNADGGVNGRQLEIEVLDDGYTAPEALKNARQFVGDGVTAIFNGCGSIQLPAIQQVAESSGTPYLFPFAALDSLLDPVKPNFFSVLPVFSDQAAGVVAAAFQKSGPGRVWLFNVQVPGSDETAKAVREATEAGGGTYVGEVTHAAGQTDYTPSILKMKAARPDYVMLAETAADAVRIVKTISDQDAMPKKSFLGTTSEANDDFLGPSADLVEGRFLTASPTVPPNSPKAKACLDAFSKADPPVPASIATLYGCGVAQALVAALQEAGDDLGGEQLIETLEGWQAKEVTDVLPPLTFTADDHLGVDTMPLLGVEDGEFVEQGSLEIP